MEMVNGLFFFVNYTPYSEKFASMDLTSIQYLDMMA